MKANRLEQSNNKLHSDLVDIIALSVGYDLLMANNRHAVSELDKASFWIQELEDIDSKTLLSIVGAVKCGIDLYSLYKYEGADLSSLGGVLDFGVYGTVDIADIDQLIAVYNLPSIVDEKKRAELIQYIIDTQVDKYLEVYLKALDIEEDNE